MKTFQNFRKDQAGLNETLEPSHDLSVLEFCALDEDELEEDGGAGGGSGGSGLGAGVNSAGSGNIAGIGVARAGDPNFAEPGVSPEYQRKRKQLKLMNGPPVDPRMFADKIFNRKPPVKATVESFIVDPETYQQCRIGSGNSHVWSSYLGESELGQAIKEGKDLIVVNTVTGEKLIIY